MTEKERMLAGLRYNSRDPELLGRYHEVRELLGAFRQTSSKNDERKSEILKSLFGGVGKDVWIEAPFFCDYGEQIHIGNHVFINYNCVFLDSNTITIGDHVLIGPGVQIYTASHPLNADERINIKENSYFTTSKPVEIGRKCWIGGGSLIMPGISIGARTTIGAGSVVTKSMPADVFAAGNPCKVIRDLLNKKK